MRNAEWNKFNRPNTLEMRQTVSEKYGIFKDNKPFKYSMVDPARVLNISQIAEDQVVHSEHSSDHQYNLPLFTR